MEQNKLGWNKTKLSDLDVGKGQKGIYLNLNGINRLGLGLNKMDWVRMELDGSEWSWMDRNGL